MASSSARYFHCTPRFKKAVRKAKHKQVAKQCGPVQQLLALYPSHGVPHDRHRKVRKMRVAVPDAGFGKRGGYRAVYRAVKDEENDTEWYLVLLDLFAKSDIDDLADDRYETLVSEAEEVLEDIFAVDWETVPGGNEH